MKTEPFWTDEFPRPDDMSVTNELPSSVDVVIVGSGYTGLNAARVLAKSGASVAVFERNTIGWGASSRNGGMATPGLKLDISKIIKNYGAELGREFWQASVDAIDLLDTIINEEKIDCDWHRNGHCSLAYKQSHFDEMEEYAEWLDKEFGHKKTLVAKSEIRNEIGTDAFYGGLSDETSGGLQPAKYVFGLATAVGKQGVLLYENSQVKPIKKTSKGFQVSTSNGTVHANEVIVATNGYTDLLVPGLRPRVFPVGSYIIVTEPLTGDLKKILSPKNRMFYDSKIFINYFRLTSDGRFLWGGRNNLSTDLDLIDSAEQLQKQMVSVFPELKDVSITHSWTGKLGVTFDLMPHIGCINGIHYANGYSGHGLSIATYLGTELGLMLTGQKDRSPFEEINTRMMPLYRNKTWFLPLAEKYHRFLDWMS
ncbi:MAG: FAD-binding oxidoreductase [Candidatus Marinimicrobia bacterium]|nr:FAD-binding oxidoreductase [Candidatus Neomarinimicrobiota bacterium]